MQHLECRQGWFLFFWEIFAGILYGDDILSCVFPFMLLKGHSTSITKWVQFSRHRKCYTACEHRSVVSKEKTLIMTSGFFRLGLTHLSLVSWSNTSEISLPVLNGLPWNCTDIHGPQRMDPNDFGDLLTSSCATSKSSCHLSWEIPRHLLTRFELEINNYSEYFRENWNYVTPIKPGGQPRSMKMMVMMDLICVRANVNKWLTVPASPVSSRSTQAGGIFHTGQYNECLKVSAKTGKSVLFTFLFSCLESHSFWLLSRPRPSSRSALRKAFSS